MRLLLVVDYFSDPPLLGTAVIAHHWGRWLRRHGHEVDLLVAREPWDPAWDGYLDRNGIGRAPAEVPWRSVWARGLAPLRGEPPSLRHVDADTLARRLAPLLYDGAILVSPYLLPLAEALHRLDRGPRVVFVPTDSPSMVLRSRRRRPAGSGRRGGPAGRGPLVRARERVEERLWERAESTRFARLPAVVFVSGPDADHAAERWAEAARARVHVIPNGVDTEHFRPTGLAERPHELVFTGNLWTYDSMQAGTWLAEEVLPAVAAVVPDVVFRMAGRRPHPRLWRLAAADPRVEVDGDVPDIRPCLERAAVYVCPLQSGGGIKNRLLEALAMARPAVTTREGMAGTDLVPGEHLLLADDAPAFADAVARLLGDAALRRRIGDAARAAAVARFSWEAGTARVEAILDSI